MTTVACLSRRDPISDSERLAILFLMPENPSTLGQQMQVFRLSVQRSVWVRVPGERVMLRVKFMGGTEDQKTLVREVVEEEFNKEPQFMNIRFEFVNPDEMAHIRISFYAGQQNWSSIGNDALFVDKNVPTMNFEELSRSNVLHLFGHSLGFEHEEFFDPDIRWNEPVVNAAFALAPHFWSTEMQMQRNFYALVNLNQFYNSQTFNPNSLMCNIWPCTFFLDPKPTTCNPTMPNNFDEQDKAFFASYYPFPQQTSNFQLRETRLTRLINENPSKPESSPIHLQPHVTCSKTNFSVLWVTILSACFVLGVIFLGVAFRYRKK
jgi:hypothetical protein